MRRASLVLALAFVFASGACNDRGGGNDRDAAAQEDATAQFDTNIQQDAAQSDVLPQSDAPPTNTANGTSLIKCGSGFCDITNHEECCVTGTTLDCQAAGTCAGYGTLECDGPEDCYMDNAPVCCGSISGSGGGASCTSACTGGGMTLCHVDETCGTGNKCCGAITFGGLDIQYCLPEADCVSGPTTGVPCGSTSCTGGDACCMTFSGGTCGLPATCTQGLPLRCDGPEECQTGEVCCATVIYDGSGLSGGSICGTTCDTTGSLLGGVMCHSNDDCQSPKTCKTAGYGGFTFHLCQ